MKRNVIIFVAAVLVLVGAWIFWDDVFGVSNRRLMDVEGVRVLGKGCGSVGGVFLVDCDGWDMSVYDGKRIVVSGYVSDYECVEFEQCYDGLYMDKVLGVEVVLDNDCVIDGDCNFDVDGNCVNVPFDSEKRVSDHPGCACYDGKCADAICEPPCELG